MKLNTLFPFLFLALLSNEAIAVEFFYVDTGHGGGRAISRIRQQECFAITPHHVLAPGKVMITTEQQQQSRAMVIREHKQDDIAILRVEDQTMCDYGNWPDNRTIRSALKEVEFGVLVGRTPSGALQRIPVYISFVSERYVSIVPKQENIDFLQGLSGSALMMDGKLAGMLITVNPRSREGKALRLDFIQNLLETFFEQDISPFKNNSDGTITDTRTNLMWAKHDRGAISFDDAQRVCNNLILGKHNNWRLPTIDELETLYDPEDRREYNDRKWYIPYGGPDLNHLVMWSSTKVNRDTVYTIFYTAEPANYKHKEQTSGRPDLRRKHGALCVR